VDFKETPPRISPAASVHASVLLGIFFISGCLVVVVNLAVDLLYSLLDPRIELR